MQTREEIVIMSSEFITETELAKQLREKYMLNTPEGYTTEEISRMKDDDILDMDYFLNE